MQTIHPIEPEGLKQSPIRKPSTTVTPVPEIPAPPIVTKVGWPTLILEWIRTNMSNDILNYFKGDTMDTKLWYASKTFWTNIITLLWTFIGPLIGIPTLDPETMLGILAVINVILRIVTKQPVALK